MSEEVANGVANRLNSGFYLVINSRGGKAALAAIVEHGTHTSTEQPSFWEVLCNGRGKASRPSSDRCEMMNRAGRISANVTVLDRVAFANGAVSIGGRGVFDTDYGNGLLLSPEQLVVHNNWVGASMKLQRQVRTGTWYLRNDVCQFEQLNTLGSKDIFRFNGPVEMVSDPRERASGYRMNEIATDLRLAAASDGGRHTPSPRLPCVTASPRL